MNEKFKFNVVGINDFSYRRCRYSLVIKRPYTESDDDGLLYVKGDD